MKNIKYCIDRISEKYKVKITQNTIDLKNITVFSQNCIGGVMYHDCGARFLSPTVNLYMLPSDFIKFVNNFEFYLSQKPEITMGENYPIGYFSDGLKVNFMHYKTVDEALDKWESRKKRINKDKIFIICVERDGFNYENYIEFKKIKYPKVLFTIKKELDEDSECIYIPKFKKEEQLPDIIPGRYMYYKNKLPLLITKAFEK